MPAKLTAGAALDRYFLETRCKIIEIAASLDRIERGGDAASTKNDRRAAQIQEAIATLSTDGDDRARKCQMIFSLPYDKAWKAPNAAR